MRRKKIRYYIRKQNLIRSIVPTSIVVLISLVIMNTHLRDYLSPNYVDDITTFSSYDISRSPFVTTTLSDLTYSGLNEMSGNDIIGGYYYYFVDDKCYFAVLSPMSNEAPFPEHIDAISLIGKLEYDSPHLTNITNVLAQKLNWTPQDLVSVTGNVTINEPAFNPILTGIIILLLILLVSVCLANMLVLILGIIFPSFALATMRRNNFGSLPKLLNKAEKEYAENVLYGENGMYITTNYFININYNQVSIIPLDQIVWAYYHSVLHRNFLFKHTISYSLRLVTDRKQIFTAPRKTKTNCTEVLDMISTMYPEILIGYTDENHLDFLYQIKNFFGNKKDKNSTDF